MRKFNKYLILTITAALLAGVVFSQAGAVSAQQNQPVGVVVAYIPGQSITIADQTGAQHEYMLSQNVKILPPGRANALVVGTFVTIIAPASLDRGKQTAVGIVVHPHIPNGWTVPSMTATPAMSATPAESFTPTPENTLTTTETPTATGTGTQTVTETATATATVEGTPSGTPTATATLPAGNPAVTTDTFIEWLRSLFRQLLASR